PQSGGYPRPKGATPSRLSLEPAYKQCTSSNRTQCARRASPSCNPRVQSSSFLTIGSPDANGAPANSIASAQFDVLAGNPATPADQAELRGRSSGPQLPPQSHLTRH